MAGAGQSRNDCVRNYFEEATMSTTAITAIPTGTWNVDPTHSGIEFTVKHLGIATVRGRFGEFEGQLVMGDDPSQAKATGTVRAAAVDTNEPARDDHLRSADFFDVANYPEITFESTEIKQVDESVYHVTGDLTLHGVTKPITLHAESSGTEQDPWGNTRVGIEASGEVSRGDYGMKFNQALGSGNMMVSDRVRINLDISAVKQDDDA